MKSNSQQATTGKENINQALLELLLFVDHRSSSRDNIDKIENHLQDLKQDYSFALKVIDIKEQPHLVEHFRLVATPALVKISPLPRQTLAGSDLIAQLKKWWPQWQIALEKLKDDSVEPESSAQSLDSPGIGSLGYSAELMKLSDEIFRLKKEKEELLEQLKFKDQVLAMLAHDLRSPLTAASISVETLELAENHQDAERVASLKGQLYKQARKQFQIMSRMIEDLLEASKSMNGKLHVKPHPLSLQSLCQEIVTHFKERLKAKSQTLETDLPQDVPKVYADEELVRQAIVNLLDNALKYTPEKGKIKISILHRTAQKVQITVSDTGPGIPEETKDRIFEGHFRLKRDENKDGYGLGLSLCRKIIGAHYGQIWVDSIPDEGSCFHFTLPIY
ncbi:MAG: histidine kinase [Prochloraceae cyanobacterium]|nr:histidine kinase [Prochloraceae cyanobacterium]